MLEVSPIVDRDVNVLDFLLFTPPLRNIWSLPLRNRVPTTLPEDVDDIEAEGRCGILKRADGLLPSRVADLDVNVWGSAEKDR